MTTGPSTHFAPIPKKLSRDTSRHAVPVISVTALAGIPAFIRAEFGERTLAKVNQSVMLDVEMVEDQDVFIPHIVMSEFVHEAARQSGEDDFGLILAPHLSLWNYGCWGRYVLDAATVGEGIVRAMQSVAYHSRGDHMSLLVRDGLARFVYASAAKGRDGYRHVACGAIGVMLSYCRAYLGPAWHPLRIDLDIPRPRRPGMFEDAFGCPVVFDAPDPAIYFDARVLAKRAPLNGRHPVVTIEDLARARLERRNLDRLVGIVADHIRAQVATGIVSIESSAHALDTSVRTLQRELNREGTDYRTLTNAIRSERAMELLRLSDMSIARIAADLGYSAPAHFARAFRKTAGISPQEFRRQRFPTTST